MAKIRLTEFDRSQYVDFSGSVKCAAVLADNTEKALDRSLYAGFYVIKRPAALDANTQKALDRSLYAGFYVIKRPAALDANTQKALDRSRVLSGISALSTTPARIEPV